jgi:very-long-chain (3R)-3-hydroxyacyl-CoA dehydratase
MQLGPGDIFEGTVDYVTYVQTAAVLELIHSAVGILLFPSGLSQGLVRSPLLTTAGQVFSRLFLTWGICMSFPDSVRMSLAYPVMLSAWSSTEIIRYSFYAWNILDEVPYPLLWLRYLPLDGR